jgi:hypothetical protein
LRFSVCWAIRCYLIWNRKEYMVKGQLVEMREEEGKKEIGEENEEEEKKRRKEK